MYQLTAINYQIDAKRRKRETKPTEEVKKDTSTAMEISDSAPSQVKLVRFLN